ncbi:MAG: hypothetical protein FWF31_00740 [Desulfobulbus sp.]|nr:hypothetical protein [Desulfobulbus sp.]
MQTFILARLIALAAVAVFLAGCAGGPPAGQWTTDSRAQDLFESGVVLPDHAYYYIGSFAMPDSVIAIDRRFTLRTRVWAETDMTEAKLNGWLHMFRTENYPAACIYRGGVILTPDGRRAGYWYSRNIYNIIYMPEEGVLEVYRPHADAGRVCGQDINSK